MDIEVCCTTASILSFQLVIPELGMENDRKNIDVI